MISHIRKAFLLGGMPQHVLDNACGLVAEDKINELNFHKRYIIIIDDFKNLIISAMPSFNDSNSMNDCDLIIDIIDDLYFTPGNGEWKKIT